MIITIVVIYLVIISDLIVLVDILTIWTVKRDPVSQISLKPSRF